MNKIITNKKGYSAKFTKKSQREIKSNLKNTKKNGFSEAEHFEIANKIINTYQNSVLIKRHKDTKNKTANVFMERFLSREIKLSTGRNTRVCITIKDDSKQKSIYSIELMHPRTALKQTKAKGK